MKMRWIYLCVLFLPFALSCKERSDCDGCTAMKHCAYFVTKEIHFCDMKGRKVGGMIFKASKNKACSTAAKLIAIHFPERKIDSVSTDKPALLKRTTAWSKQIEREGVTDHPPVLKHNASLFLHASSMEATALSDNGTGDAAIKMESASPSIKPKNDSKSRDVDIKLQNANHTQSETPASFNQSQALFDGGLMRHEKKQFGERGVSMNVHTDAKETTTNRYWSLPVSGVVVILHDENEGISRNRTNIHSDYEDLPPSHLSSEKVNLVEESSTISVMEHSTVESVTAVTKDEIAVGSSAISYEDESESKSNHSKGDTSHSFDHSSLEKLHRVEDATETANEPIYSTESSSVDSVAAPHNGKGERSGEESSINTYESIHKNISNDLSSIPVEMDVETDERDNQGNASEKYGKEKEFDAVRNRTEPPFEFFSSSMESYDHTQSPFPNTLDFQQLEKETVSTTLSSVEEAKATESELGGYRNNSEEHSSAVSSVDFDSSSTPAFIDKVEENFWGESEENALGEKNYEVDEGSKADCTNSTMKSFQDSKSSSFGAPFYFVIFLLSIILVLFLFLPFFKSNKNKNVMTGPPV